jgi:hypothetical protein
MTLERAILEGLSAAQSATSRPLNEQVIRGAAGSFLPDPPTLADVQAALRSLENKGQVAGTQTEDRGPVYVLTAKGRLRLAE